MISPHWGLSGLRRHLKERPLDIILESKVESADVAESLIGDLSERDFSELERHEISLAVREAIANAVLHRNQFDACNTIFLNAHLRTAGLASSVRQHRNESH